MHFKYIDTRGWKWQGGREHIVLTPLLESQGGCADIRQMRSQSKVSPGIKGSIHQAGKWYKMFMHLTAELQGKWSKQIADRPGDSDQSTDLHGGHLDYFLGNWKPQSKSQQMFVLEFPKLSCSVYGDIKDLE